MTAAQPARRFFFLLLAAVSILFAIVARPIASALFLAAVLAGVLWPLHRWLDARLRGRTASAGALVLVVLMTLVGPTVAFSAFAIQEGSDGVRFVSQTVRSKGVIGLVDHLPPTLRGWAKQGLDRMSPEGDKSLPDSLQEQLSRSEERRVGK